MPRKPVSSKSSAPVLRPGDLESYDSYLRWIVVALQDGLIDEKKAFELRKCVDSLRQLCAEKYRQGELEEMRQIRDEIKATKLAAEQTAKEIAKTN